MSSLSHTHLLTPSLVDFNDTVSAGVSYNSNKSSDVLWSCSVLDNEANNVSVLLIISTCTIHCMGLYCSTGTLVRFWSNFKIL